MHVPPPPSRLSFLLLAGCCLIGFPLHAQDEEAGTAILPDADDIEIVDDEAPLETPPKARVGSDWPVFLGPTGDGISPEKYLRTDWPEKGLPILWQQKVGTGYSAPSVLKNQVILHDRVGDEERVICFTANTGKKLWTYSYPTRYRDPYGYNNGPRATPLVTKDRVYTFGAEGKLTCLTLEKGKPIWQRDVMADYDIPRMFFGLGCTPVLEDGLIITFVGGQPNAGVVAFDAKTGKTAWEHVGQETWNGAETRWRRPTKYEWSGREMIVSYSSPIVATIHRKRHLLCLVRHGLVSLDPKTGAERFKYWFRSRKHESVNAARPVVVGNRILISSTYDTGAALLEVQPNGIEYEVVWAKPDNLQTHWSTAVVVDGYAYGFSGRHEGQSSFRCIDMTDGEVQWKTNGYEGNINDLGQNPVTGELVDRDTGKTIPWPFYGRGSLIQTGDHFIVLGERGTLALVKIDPKKWNEIARQSAPDITAPSWTAPVLSRSRLFLRDEDTLTVLDLSPVESK